MYCFQGGSCLGHWQDASHLASGPSGREALRAALLRVCLCTCAIERESDLCKGFPWSFEADWTKPSCAFAVLGGLVKKPRCEAEG